MPPRILMIAATLVISGSFHQALQPSQATLARVDGVVERERAKARIPGLSVTIGLGGHIISAKSFGLADVENNVPVTRSKTIRSGMSPAPSTSIRPTVTACSGAPSKAHRRSPMPSTSPESHFRAGRHDSDDARRTLSDSPEPRARLSAADATRL